MVKGWVSDPASNNGLRVSLLEEEIDETDSWENSIVIPGSDGDWYVGRPELTINFSNPTYDPKSFAISAGSVEEGDTVLVAYKNEGDYLMSTTKDSRTDTINGDEFKGKLFTYQYRWGPDPIGRYDSEFMRLFVYLGENNSDEILLGETKYYAAIWKDPAKKEKITIEEVETRGSGEPIEPSGLISGAFKSNPIEVVSDGKSGVYWERKWATVNDDGSISSGNLPSGMIRVVGRYWEEGKDYKVKLKAEAAGSNGELEIKVIKPDRLGDKYGKARDVFDEVVDVDSMIIANAGKYGIPPQMIKAHISVEAAKKDFGGEVGWGFAPSYRYEPYTTQLSRYLEYWAGDYFFEDSTTTNFSNIPRHQHVLFDDYYREVKTVWDVIKNNSQLVKSSAPSTYGKRNANGKMNFGKYTSIQGKYDSFYKPIAADTALMNTKVADSTNKLMTIYLRDNWNGGAKNMIAQTRAASSYGYLQMLYTTAREKVDYSKDRVPEKMNEEDFFVEFIIYQRDELLKNKESKNDWSEGFEKAILNTVFEVWNEAPNYPKDVFKKVENYKPQN